MILKPKYFLLSTLCTLILFSAAYIYAFRYQLGSAVQAEWWVQHIYYFKDYVAKNITERKIIVVAGSNALFGINSSIIEQKTSIKTVNLAGHVELGMDYFYHKINEHMRDGDIVVMPLELRLYSKTGPTYWFIDNMLAWGLEDYLSKLSLWEAAKFIFLIPPKRLLNGVIKQNGINPLLSREQVIADVKENTMDKNLVFLGYSHLSLNQHGDLIVNLPPKKDVLEVVENGNGYDIAGKLVPSGYFLGIYKKIQNIVEQRNGKLILVWPVTIRNKDFDLANRKGQKLVDNFRRMLADSGVDIRCNPASFNLNFRLFFDTKYHPNRYGTLIRSENLSDCLNNILSDGSNYKEVSYEVVNKKLRLQEASWKQKMNFITTNFQIRKNDLTAITSALAKYHTRVGSYPASDGWDGLYTHWGTSGRHWISGLTPDYLYELPRDPRLNSDPMTQYLYRSDGVDYKIIAHSPEDYNEAIKQSPKLIDPYKNRQAYGYWTEEARNW